MTVTEIKKETKRLAKWPEKDLNKLMEAIEDMIDLRAIKDFEKREAAGKVKLIPWETVKAKLDKRLADS